MTHQYKKIQSLQVFLKKALNESYETVPESGEVTFYYHPQSSTQDSAPDPMSDLWQFVDCPPGTSFTEGMEMIPAARKNLERVMLMPEYSGTEDPIGEYIADTAGVDMGFTFMTIDDFRNKVLRLNV